VQLEDPRLLGRGELHDVRAVGNLADAERGAGFGVEAQVRHGGQLGARGFGLARAADDADAVQAQAFEGFERGDGVLVGGGVVDAHLIYFVMWDKYVTKSYCLCMLAVTTAGRTVSPQRSGGAS